MYFLPPKEVSKGKCFLVKADRPSNFIFPSVYTPAAIKGPSPSIFTPSLCKADRNEEVYGDIWLVQNSLEVRDTTPRILEAVRENKHYSLVCSFVCVGGSLSTKRVCFQEASIL